MTFRPRPAYIERKRELEQERRWRLRHHAQPCDCWACITPSRLEELKLAALARNLGAGEEVLF